MLNVLSSFVVINRIGSSLVMACDCSPCKGPTLNKIFQHPTCTDRSFMEASWKRNGCPTLLHTRLS